MTKVNDKYYVPVEIDGKWWVVENVLVPDAEDYHSQDGNGLYFDEDGYKDHCDLYCNPPKYPTLSSDSAYWASKEGVKMTSEEFEVRTLSKVSEETVDKLLHQPLTISEIETLAKQSHVNYAIPLQSPTTKELIEQEAERLFHADTDGVFHKPSWLDGATFALSLPKQDNGDEVYLKLILKIQSWVLDDKTKDTDKLLQDLKQQYSISKK